MQNNKWYISPFWTVWRNKEHKIHFFNPRTRVKNRFILMFLKIKLFRDKCKRVSIFGKSVYLCRSSSRLGWLVCKSFGLPSKALVFYGASHQIKISVYLYHQIESMKIKILLVEDDTSLGFVISDQLKTDGYQVTLCTDGAEGFKRFNEEKFHLCIFFLKYHNALMLLDSCR